MVDRLKSTDILASLSSHVRLKLARLGDALSLELRDTERLLLADLLAEHDALTRRVHAFDRHIDEELTPYADQCRLLETLPGIDHTSACAILSEMGPDPSVFGNAHRFAAWAGLCPGNNESAGKRRLVATPGAPGVREDGPVVLKGWPAHRDGPVVVVGENVELVQLAQPAEA